MIAFVGCTDIPQGAIVDQNERIKNEAVDPDPVPITRPEDQIFINPNFCVCRKGSPVNISPNCGQTCSAQSPTDNNPLMYLDVTVGAALQNSQFQNLKGWCSQNLIDPETGEDLDNGNNQACFMVFTDKDTQFETRVEIQNTQINNNTIAGLNLAALSENKRYSFTINEIASGLNSNVKDLTIYTELVDTLLDVPLWIEPIYQYACVSSTVTTDPDNNGTIFYDNAEKIHFYYDAENKPDPSISTSNININCHTQSPPNNQTPLIDNTPGQIKTWSKNDVRFADYVDPDTGTVVPGTFYIDKILEFLVLERGFSIPTPKLFNKFEYFTDPLAASDGGTQKLMGYIMKAFRDQSTQEFICPTQSDYIDESQPLMQALGDILREDTQPIYLAKQQDKTNDFIFILKEDVKNAWFYLNEDNQEVRPTNDTIRGKKIQFYWPISQDTPLVKKPHQVVYTIQAPSGDPNPANLPADKRIGCAPKI